MDWVQTLVIGIVVSAVGGALAWMLHGQRTEAREDNRGLRAEVKGDIQELRGEIREVRDELRSVRSDLTQVALAVGAGPRAENA